jgi:hypothetical protein
LGIIVRGKGQKAKSVSNSGFHRFAGVDARQGRRLGQQEKQRSIKLPLPYPTENISHKGQGEIFIIYR